MLNKLRERAQGESGFTLIELLVVMLIIGLLAAIAIPSFFNQRDKANDADAKEAARTAQTAMETYATDKNGKYTGATVALLQGIEPALKNNTLAVSNVTDNTYTVTVTSDSGSTQTFGISRAADGTLTYPCTTGGKGGCPAAVGSATPVWN